jgi:hypothetical protein
MQKGRTRAIRGGTRPVSRVEICRVQAGVADAESLKDQTLDGTSEADRITHLPPAAGRGRMVLSGGFAKS